MITLKELKNGNLEITSTEFHQLKDIIKQYADEREGLREILERASYLGNNWEAPTEIGLTETPAIAWGVDYGDEGLTTFEKLWYFPNYMIENCLEILDRDGKVIFQRHRE